MRKLVKLLLVIISFSGCSNINSEFELCSGGKRPYYYPTLTYKGGFYKIKNHFYNNCKIMNNPNSTGIVKIRFDVNCKGETGNFIIDTYSINYKDEIINEKTSNTTSFLGIITYQLLRHSKRKAYRFCFFHNKRYGDW